MLHGYLRLWGNACRQRPTLHAASWTACTVQQRMGKAWRLLQRSRTKGVHVSACGRNAPWGTTCSVAWHLHIQQNKTGDIWLSQGTLPREGEIAETSERYGGRSNDHDTRTEYHGGIDHAGDGGSRLWHADRRRHWRWEWCRHWRRDGEHQERCPHWYRCRRCSGSDLRLHPLALMRHRGQ